MSTPDPHATPGMSTPGPHATPGMSTPGPHATPGMSTPDPHAIPGMSMPDPYAIPGMSTPDPHAWGVLRSYVGTDRKRRRVTSRTLRAVLEALGARGPAPEETEGVPLVVVAGTRGAAADGTRYPLAPGSKGWHGAASPASAAASVAPGSEVELETGEAVPCPGGLLPDLPLGYHRLHSGGSNRPLIVVPPRCHPVAGLGGFGFAVQLYAARSEASWGIGDLADLAELGRFARSLGASTLVVSPLHATLPLPPVEPSPYFPSSRVFLNPLHLRPVPGSGGEIDSHAGMRAGETGNRGSGTGEDGARADGAGGDGAREDGALGDLARAAQRLNANRRIDRDRVAALKMAALGQSFATGGGRSAAERALAGRPLLRDFALFSALAERHGQDWRAWPDPLARRRPDALHQAAGELSERVRFHAWLQVELDRQMDAAGAELPVISDLAVGVHPGGFDAWIWQDLLAPGVSVGAPPDTFNTLGQDWQIPAFDPWKLRAAGYAPFVETLRAGMRHGGGVRLDHVMGLERLWWIPAGTGPAEGVYVRYPLDDLLGIVALESLRHRAVVVGEDLGTVPRGLRSRLRGRGLLGYVLLLFEDRPPSGWPRQAVAAITTHDLPTVAGLWDGSDLEERRRLGLPADPAGARELVARIRRGGLGREADAGAVILHAHRRLAQSPCAILVATLEDLAGVRERPNQPGLVGPPNWSQALPLSLDRLEALPMVAQVARILSRRG